MRSFHTGCTLLALLAGVIATSSLSQITRNEGGEFEAAVLTLDDDINECHLSTPNDDFIEFIPNYQSNDKFQLLDATDETKCRVRVRHLDLSDTGVWTLSATNAAGFKQEQSYNVIVSSEPDTETTTQIPDEPKTLDEQHFDTNLGTTHVIVIPNIDFVNTDSCHIITPDGLRAVLGTVDVPGVKFFKDFDNACGVKLTVESEEMIGTWMLISKDIYLGLESERRLPFTISVEEKVNTVPRVINVIEGNDFYARLENPTPHSETCKLLKPDGRKYEEYDTDPRYVDTCGFIVRSVKTSENGTWAIVYGNKISYNAPFEVKVASKSLFEEQIELVWTRDQPVHELLGPYDAVYCKVYDPKNLVVFEDFGRCNITLPRATSDHQGSWRMYIGLNGHVVTTESVFTVRVIGESPKSEVVTKVILDRPIVTLSCVVSSPYPIRACKFRTPTGRILIASPGVGQDNYSFHGKLNSYGSDVHTHDCGIRIVNPRDWDLGLWRCAIETRNQTYYGFLSALWPWAMRDPEVAAGVITEPTLTTSRWLVHSVDGDSVRMSCSVQSAIRYCYFRTSNGTVYNVGPGSSSSDLGVYIGAGLDAGECGIQFRRLAVADSGQWSCHVGFHDMDMPEQRANFTVHVRDMMVVGQTETTVRAVVEGRELDYCRFVRVDGFGFTSDAVPAGYFVKAFTHIGECTLWALNTSNSRLDRRPWTVVAKITGQTGEISRTTSGAVPPTPFPSPLPVFWLLFMLLGLSLIMSAALVGPKKNRNWVYARAANIRTSFRQSFAKKAVKAETVSERNTANAA